MSFTELRATTYTDVDNNGDYFKVFEENIFLTKRILKDGTSIKGSMPRKYKLGKFFNPGSLEELVPFLDKLINDPKKVLIRYKYTSLYMEGDVVSRKKELVTEVPSKIIAIDVDSLSLLNGMGCTDLKAQGEYICHLLHKCSPEMFPDDMGFVIQASSSAGLSDKIKAHIFISNEYELTQSQLRNVFYHVNSVFKSKVMPELKVNLVDPALYHVVQPLYLAAPIFENRSQDPFKGLPRMYYHCGSNSTIPKGYSPYVSPVKTTEVERELYLKSVDGSFIISKELDEKLERLRSWDASVSGFRIAVISLYHTALQKQFNLKALSDILKPIINTVRPGQADEYCRQGEISALNHIKACSKREIPSKCKGLELKPISGGSDPKYLKVDYRHIPKDSVTFLKASLGTGKTHTIAKWINKGYIKGRFLAITDTAALVEANAVRFSAGDFRKYSDLMDFTSGKINRLSGTLHSLKKIRGMRFDFLFIDEADSLLNNLLFASIIKEEDKAQITEILAELLMTTPQVIISDGDISEETVSCYIDLMEGSRPLYKIEHIRKNLSGVIATQHTSEGSLWGAMAESLAIGDKCLLVSDSSPRKLNEYLIALSRKYPDKVIKVVHSDSKMDDDVRDIINNTTKALRRQEVDALLCSPSVTNGVDFNYFDTVFVLTTTDNHTPNMRYQAMMRERQPSSIHFYFKDIKRYSTGYSGLVVDNGFTAKARQAMALRREREYNTYTATFNYYLVEAGAKVVVEDEPYESPMDAEAKEEAKNQLIEAILLSNQNTVIKRHNTAYELKQMLMHYYDIEEVTWDDCERFIKEKPHERAEYLHKVYLGFWDVLQTNDPVKVAKALSEKGDKFFLATGESVAGGITRAKMILRKCGIFESGGREPAENAIYWYKKYCEITSGAELPAELRDNNEKVRDLL
jgi:hypothetical protein